MATAAEDNATLTEIRAAYNQHLRDLLTALDAGPLTSGIAACVELVSFFDDGSVAHRREGSIGQGLRFYRQRLNQT